MDILIILIILAIIFLTFIVPGLIGFMLKHPFIVIALILLNLIISSYKKTNRYTDKHNQRQTNKLYLEIFPVFVAYIISKSFRKKELVLSTKKIILQHFDEKTSQKIMNALKEYNINGITNTDLQKACFVCAYSTDFQSRITVLAILEDIINTADGNPTQEEANAFEHIANNLGIQFNQSSHSSESNQNTYQQQPLDYDPYDELGVTRSASNEEIKKAYRQLCKKYHPDKTSSLPENERKQAEEKIRKVISAYDKIKQERPGL